MRARRLFVAGAVLAALALSGHGPALAQEVRVTTPYPAVLVEPGGTTTFDLIVTATGRQRVGLRVTEAPEGWTTSLRGGGYVLNGVFTDPHEPPEVQLEVEVPPDAERGLHRVVVEATSSAGTDTLELDLRVSRAARGGVELTAEFPGLRGPSDTTFIFDLDIENDTPQETSFALETQGPEGWLVEARPTVEEQAATVTVGPGDSAGVQVEVDPPDDVVAGTYPILVRAVGGGRTAETELEVEITGNFALALRTQGDRPLNVDVPSGGTAELPLVVVNEGTAPLTGISLGASPPAGWNVTFRPNAIEQLLPGERQQLTATIAPAEDALAGDYMVTLSADGAEASSDLEVRATVRTSTAWGILGLLLVVGSVAGLGYVFRRYGRR